MAQGPSQRLNFGGVLFGVIFITNGFSLFRNVPEWQITGKWFGTIAATIVFVAVGSAIKLVRPERRIIPDVQACSLYMAIINIAVVMYCLLQIFGIVRNGSLFRAVADFDNPAGVAALLCVSFPFAIMVSFRKQKRMFFALFVFVIDASILFLIQSRTGLIALTASAFVGFLFHDRGRSVKYGSVILASVMIIVLACSIYILFCHKTASTNGRMVIYNTCMRMLADRPLLGYGPGGFDKNYMYWQADYLKTVCDDNILMLSDNVTHPLSEFLLIAVNYGLVGLSIVIGLIAYAIALVQKREGRVRSLLLMLMCSIGTLSLFSYPFRYPMTTVALVCFVVLLFKDSFEKILNDHSRTVSTILLVAATVSIIYVVKWYKAQVYWKVITDGLNAGKENALELKRDLLPFTDQVLAKNPRYMYSRAVVSYYAGDYSQALTDVRNSMEKLSSYDTELLMGSILEKMERNTDAEMHYREASYMCPSRITPLYRLFRLYEAEGDTVSMVMTGNELLEKPVKIPSHDTRAMRLDVRRKLLYL